MDDIHQQTKKNKDEDEDESMESLDDFQKRINLFVEVHLHRARAKGNKRDHYKDALVFQARRDLINEFWKVIQAKKCQNKGCAACVVHYFFPP